MKFKHLPRLSISAYTLILALTTFGIFGVLSKVTMDDMQSFNESLTYHKQQSAQQELAKAIGVVNRKIDLYIEDLLNWDELRQQLVTSTYYAYWHQTRLMHSDKVQTDVDMIALYDKKGQVLARLDGVHLPDQVPENNDHYLLQRDEETIYLIVYKSVLGDNEKRLGYVGVRFDFLNMLLKSGHFLYLDVDSLTVNLQPGEVRPYHQIASLFSYKTRESESYTSLQNLMKDSLTRIFLGLLLIVLMFYILLATLISRPLRSLSRFIDNLKNASGNRMVTHFNEYLPISELDKVRTSLNEYQVKLNDMHNQLDASNRDLWDMAHHDPLTGVFNRRAFDEDWAAIRSTLADQRITISFVLFDCNHFKAINDTYGHQVGDEVIKALAESIKTGLRHGDKLYRLGGDEFATLLINASAMEASAVANRCLHHMSQFNFAQLGINEPVKASVGIGSADTEGMMDLAKLQWQADVAMYRAKRPGGDAIVIYSDELDDGTTNLFSNWALSIVYEVISEQKGMMLHYQPIINLKNDQVEYYEVLTRIQKDNELIMPSTFMPLLEARRLEMEFDLSVINAIVQDLQANYLPKGKGISFNLSGYTVVSDKLFDYLKPLANYVKDYKLVLEVTESSMITRVDKAFANLLKARELGFVIALDDFGSGYSSLRYLTNMPVDLVKFDITLIRQLAEGGQAKQVIEQLAKMMSQSGYSIVAEGIENAEVETLLKQFGFDYAQGYYYGYPERKLALTKRQA